MYGFHSDISIFRVQRAWEVPACSVQQIFLFSELGAPRC